MTENTELAERINSIVSQVTSLIATYGKPGADSAAAGREVGQMLVEALTSGTTHAVPRELKERIANALGVSSDLLDSNYDSCGKEALHLAEGEFKLESWVVSEEPDGSISCLSYGERQSPEVEALLQETSNARVYHIDAKDDGSNQMLNEALTPSVAWAAAKPMQPGEHYAGHVCVATGTSADEYEIIIDAYIQRARENLESIKQDVAAFNKIGDVFVDADQDESADDGEPNPLIKHEPQPDPLAVTKRLLR